MTDATAISYHNMIAIFFHIYSVGLSLPTKTTPATRLRTDDILHLFAYSLPCILFGGSALDLGIASNRPAQVEGCLTMSLPSE
ncbi:uncharacterized protein B0T15DRAFT_544304 [Chaetomium strumarium]|uniref:Uncharacterized protein n=1 Tax=Chaetomium strumarium TaxID=1170767 RepID=A0AAJ0GKL3_9PEZI|nr:hypothetical protein B0T15DRAFT_544304 [Chaetomium strumarium]